MIRDEYGIIILAAGNSSRLGEPKQLLQFNGQSLIRHITRAALETVGENTVVVTGSSSALIERELSGLPCTLAFNENWGEGMSASIKTGIRTPQLRNPQIRGIILAVSDQPFVSAATFHALIQLSEGAQSGIVASEYSGSLGTPAFFASSYFPALLELTGAEGAKKLFKRYSGDVSAYPFPQGSIDIDTQDDYKLLITGI
jgi:molybdenum cofactor cytidylyltransferase